MELRAAVYVNAENRIVDERTFPPGADVTIGADPNAGLVVPGWAGAAVLLISGGTLLNLSPGMRVNMCDDHGGERIVGTFDELFAAGVTMPIPLNRRRVNVRVREGVSVFTKYLAEGESESREYPLDETL